MEALASFLPQTCLCHVSSRRPSPARASSTSCFPLSHCLTGKWSAQLTPGPLFMIHPHDKRKHNQLGMTSLAEIHSPPCSTTQALGTTAGYSLHRKATLLPGQKPSQLLASEICRALMSSQLQLPCELVSIFSNARNAAAGSLLTGWGFMASHV